MDNFKFNTMFNPTSISELDYTQISTLKNMLDNELEERKYRLQQERKKLLTI